MCVFCLHGLMMMAEVSAEASVGTRAVQHLVQHARSTKKARTLPGNGKGKGKG